MSGRAAALNLQINSSSIGRVSRSKSSVYRSTTNEYATADADESCVVTSDGSLNGDRKQTETIAARLDQRASMTFSGVSRKGTHTLQTSSPSRTASPVQPLHSLAATHPTPARDVSKLRVHSEVALVAADEVRAGGSLLASQKSLERKTPQSQPNLFLAPGLAPPQDHKTGGLSTPNDSAYFTGRFGLSKDSSSHVHQLNLSCKNSLSEDDLTMSNFDQTDDQQPHAQPASKAQLPRENESSLGALEMHTAHNSDSNPRRIDEEDEPAESRSSGQSAGRHSFKHEQTQPRPQLPKISPFIKQGREDRQQSGQSSPDQRSQGRLSRGEEAASQEDDCTTDSEEEAYNLEKRDIGDSEGDGEVARPTSAVWTLDNANRDPYHFLQFLTPTGQEKFETFLSGRKRQARIASDSGRNMKQVYQVSLSAVELDKFEEIKAYQDLRVLTVFVADENLDRVYFKARGLQLKQNMEQQSNNRKRMAETFAVDPLKRHSLISQSVSPAQVN